MGFVRRPGKLAGLQVDACPGRRARIEAVRERTGRNVGVGDDGRECKFGPFVDRLVGNRFQHGRLDGNRKRLGGFFRRRTVVGNPDGNIVGVKGESLIQRPGEEARGRVDLGPGG